MGPLVSVIIPVYNVEQYLDRCIRSVAEQTYKNLEIILVDDGSTDKCPEICENWAAHDARIKVIHKDNAGLGMARNSGIDCATGEYICFFDSDDYVDLGTVEKCVSALLRDHSDAVIFGCVNDYGDRKIPQKLNVTQEFFEGHSVQTELLPGLFTYEMGFGVSCCMKMFRLRLINENHVRFYSEREIISEDAIFIMELFSKAVSVSVIPETLYFYYKNEHSLTNQYREDRQVKNDIWVGKALQTAEDGKLPANVQRCVQVRYHMYTISAMKQLLLSELPKNDKKRRLREMFRGSILRTTLRSEVMRLHKIPLRLFFMCLKLRFYVLCKVFIYLKIKSN